LDKYLKGTANAEESAFVEAYYAHFGEQEVPAEEGTDKRLWTKIDTRIVEMERFPAKQKRRVWAPMTAAAVIVFFCVGLIYLYNQQQRKTSPIVRTYDLSPGKAGALLKFDNQPAPILLDTAKNGVLGNGITKTAARVSIADTKEEEVAYATLSTPNGRTYQLQLPDGSVVWLNAASSIRFPTRFTGKERAVEITGEVDIRVAQNKQQPFRVRAGDQEWEVLGTEFNINAYNDEPFIRTTLLEGAVKTHTNTILKPGQQSVVRRADKQEKVMDHVNTDDVVAWKNGLFVFSDNTDLPTVLRAIARWYNVKIVYEGPIPAAELGGKISRNNSASDVLKILSYSTNIQFRIEPDKIVVLNP